MVRIKWRGGNCMNWNKRTTVINNDTKTQKNCIEAKYPDRKTHTWTKKAVWNVLVMLGLSRSNDAGCKWNPFTIITLFLMQESKVKVSPLLHRLVDTWKNISNLVSFYPECSRKQTEETLWVALTVPLWELHVISIKYAPSYLQRMRSNPGEDVESSCSGYDGWTSMSIWTKTHK